MFLPLETEIFVEPISSRNNSMRGDQYSTLVVKVPTKLTSEQKELIKKLDAVSGNTLNEFGEDKHETAEDKIKKFFKK